MFFSNQEPATVLEALKNGDKTIVLRDPVPVFQGLLFFFGTLGEPADKDANDPRHNGRPGTNSEEDPITPAQFPGFIRRGLRRDCHRGRD
jgi:hypothetical protein